MKSKIAIMLVTTGSLLILPSCVSGPVVVRPPVVAPVAPVVGKTVTVLPKGYRTVKVKGAIYYVHGNHWYRRHGGRYVVVKRPVRYRAPVRRTARAAAVHRYRKH